MSEARSARARALTVSLAAMEAAWVGVLGPLLVPPLQRVPLTVTVFALTPSLAAIAWLARRLIQDAPPTRRTYALLTLFPVAVYLVLARVLLYPHVPGTDVRWLGDLLTRLFHLLQSDAAWGLLAWMGLAWWRGVELANPPERLAGLALRFRVEILVLLVESAVLALQVGQSPTVGVWLFFAGSLVSLALVRVSEVGEVAGPEGMAFERRWVVWVALSAAVIVALGALAAAVVTLEHIGQVFRALRPVLRVVAQALISILTAAAYLIMLVVFFLARLLFGDLDANLTMLSPVSPRERGDVSPPSPLSLHLPPWVTWLLTQGARVGLVLAVLAFFLGVALTVRRERRRRAMARLEVAPAGDTGEFLADTAHLLRRWWQRVRDMAALLGRYGPGERFLAAVSVYNIYLNLLRWAEDQGYPRRPVETPYEHLARLTRAFPDLAADFRRITEAFVAARYGDLTVDPAAMEALRQAWAHIRTTTAEGPTRSPTA